MIIAAALPPSGARTVPPAPPVDVHGDVVTLTQALVQVDSGPNNLVAGENQTVDRLEAYARQAGLEVDRFETTHGKPMLIVTLPGADPSLPAVGFVHHSDVVGTEGTWKLGAPFSGALTQDEQGRSVLVGRGSVDTKGPAAQVLVAMHALQAQGPPLARTMQLFVFPDEETGGTEGAYLLSRTHPEKIRDVGSWVVEGSGILGKETLASVGAKQDAPYLAVAQKYTLPVQLQLKAPTDADSAVRRTVEALQRLDSYADKMRWTHLGQRSENREAYGRLGHFVGGFKGWAVRHFWCTRFIQRRLGTAVAAANRTDYSKTDFYLSDNAAGATQNPNVKPSSASVVLELAAPEADRAAALDRIAAAAGADFTVDPLEDPHNGKDALPVRLTMPQDHYQGGNHGSEADRAHDAVDVTDRALGRVLDEMPDQLRVADYFTSKSDHAAARDAGRSVGSTVTLDLRVAIDDDRQKVLDDIGNIVGPDFTVKPLYGQEEMDAHVRRTTHGSALFKAAEASLHEVYWSEIPVLFGNSTASNDTRYLMDANPQSEALAFVPVLYTQHGAHGPDECVTVDSLQRGTDWCVALMRRLGEK